MKIYTFVCIIILITSCSKNQPAIVFKNDLRAPAYPLIVVHPDVSIWSMGDRLNNQCAKFSGGKDFPFIGAIRADKKVYRFMGAKDVPLQTIAPISFEGEWKGKYTL